MVCGVGLAVWLASSAVAVSWLVAAGRGDEQLLGRRSAAARAVEELLSAELLVRAAGVVVALREPRAFGQVVAVAGVRDGAPLVGKVLAPDDSLTARAVLSGRCERRDRVIAVPVWHGAVVIGALGMLAHENQRCLGRDDVAVLAQAAAAFSDRWFLAARA